MATHKTGQQTTTIKGLYSNVELRNGVMTKQSHNAASLAAKTQWLKTHNDHNTLLKPLNFGTEKSAYNMENRVHMVTFSAKENDIGDKLWTQLQTWYKNMYEAGLYAVVVNEACFVIDESDYSLRYHALEYIRKTSFDAEKDAIYQYWFGPLIEDFAGHLETCYSYPGNFIPFTRTVVPGRKYIVSDPSIHWKTKEQKESIDEIIQDMVMCGSCPSCASYVSRDGSYYIRMIPSLDPDKETKREANSSVSTTHESPLQGLFGEEAFHIFNLPSSEQCSLIPTFYAVYLSPYRYDSLFLYDTPFLDVYRANNEWSDPIAWCGMIITDNWPKAKTLADYVKELPVDQRVQISAKIMNELLTLCRQFVRGHAIRGSFLQTFTPYNILVRDNAESGGRAYRVYDYSSISCVDNNDKEAVERMFAPIQSFFESSLLTEKK